MFWHSYSYGTLSKGMHDIIEFINTIHCLKMTWIENSKLRGSWYNNNVNISITVTIEWHRNGSKLNINLMYKNIEILGDLETNYSGK